MTIDLSTLNDAVKSAASSGDAAQHAVALMEYGEGLLKTSNFQEAQKPILDALDLAKGAARKDLNMQAKKLLGDYWRYKSNPMEAALLYEEVLQYASQEGERKLLADVQLAFGRLKMPQGHQDAAELMYEAAGIIYRELQDKGGEGQTVGGRGDVAGHRGNPALAKELFEESLKLCGEAGDHLGQAHTLKSLGRQVHQLEGPGPALEILKRSIDEYQKSGFRYGEAFTWQYYAQILGQEQRLPEAAEALGKAADLFEAMNLASQAGRMREFQLQVQAAMEDK